MLSDHVGVVSDGLRVAVDAVATAPGGGLTYLRNQLPALEREGVSLLVFASRPVAEELGKVLSPRSQVRAVDGRRRTGRLRFIHARLGTEARKWGADVLYCPGSTAPLRTCGLPVVLCIQNSHLFTRDAGRSALLMIQRPIAWVSAFRAAELIHISESTAREFAYCSGLRRPYSVIRSGLGDSERAPPLAREGRRDLILVVSNVYAYKAIEEVIAAFAAERDLFNSYEVVIAGKEIDAGLQRRLEDLASALGSGDVVRFAGFIPSSQLLELYQGAAVLVSMSRREAFPLPPGEALAMGVPVVLSDIMSHRELYGRWAYLVAPGDVPGLGRAMRAAVSQGPLSQDRVARVRDSFSWARNGRGLAEVLRRAATTGPVPFRKRLREVSLASLPLVFASIVGRSTNVALAPDPPAEERK